jgi:outer membrane protein assembly factor BamB
LTVAWKWTPPPPTAAGQPVSTLVGSPTVAAGSVFIGSKSGELFALDEATGAVRWHKLLGYQPNLTCGGHGIVATAAAGTDPVSANTAVYVPAGDGYVYALNASDGSLLWKTPVAVPSSTVNDYLIWSSPTLVNGRLYVGIASACDKPLVRGAVVALDQTTGSIQGTYYTVPQGSIGGTVWSTVAADGSGSLFVATGNPDETPGTSSQIGDSFSMVRVDAAGMNAVDRWQVPNLFGKDEDFGASPTLFDANLAGVSTPMVGACNKDGFMYAFNRLQLAAGPVWKHRVARGSPDPSSACVSAAAYDSSRGNLLVVGNDTTIGGVAYRGAIRALDAATGKPVWQKGLPCAVFAPPSENAAGVVAVDTYGYCRSGTSNGLYLLSAGSGAKIARITSSGGFPQPVFADGYLFLATTSGGLRAFSP